MATDQTSLDVYQPLATCRSLFAGMLACLDGYMNIAMEQTEVCCS